MARIMWARNDREVRFWDVALPSDVAEMCRDYWGDRGFGVTEYFDRALGETITDENGRKLRERANTTFEKGLAQIRKDSSL